MARTIFQLYDFTRYIVRKERGAYLQIPQFNANLYAGMLDAFNEYFAPYGETQVLHDALRPFRDYYQFTSNASGFVTFPPDYIHLLGQPFTVTGSTVNRVDFVNENQLPFALTSQSRPISNTYPIAVDTNTGFSIYPQQTQIGFFNYLRLPNMPVLAYLQAGRTIIYDPINSIQCEFTDIYVNNVIAKSLRFAGINMNEQGVSQFAEMYNKESEP